MESSDDDIGLEKNDPLELAPKDANLVLGTANYEDKRKLVRRVFVAEGLAAAAEREHTNDGQAWREGDSRHEKIRVFSKSFIDKALNRVASGIVQKQSADFRDNRHSVSQNPTVPRSAILSSLEMKHEDEKSQRHSKFSSTHEKKGEIQNTYLLQASQRTRETYEGVDAVVDTIEATSKDDATGLALTAKMEQRARRMYLVFPGSSWKQKWDIMVMMMALLVGFIVPLDIGFSIRIGESNVLKAIEAITKVVFTADLMINFNTCLEFPGNVYVFDRELIARDYLAFWFWIDLLAVLPFDEFVLSEHSDDKLVRWLAIVSMLRLLKVYRIFKRFSKIIELSLDLISAMKTIVVIGLIWHWTACSYWYTAWYQGFESSESMAGAGTQLLTPSDHEYHDRLTLLNDSLEFEVDIQGVALSTNYSYINWWVPTPELARINATLTEKYITSFFWSIMVTTGSGRDIRPTSEIELVISILFILCGVCVYAIIVGSVTSALTESEQSALVKQKKLRAIERYLNKRGLPDITKERTRNWYHYLYNRPITVAIGTEQNVIPDLHESLSLELRLFLYKPIIQQVPMFSDITNAHCLIEIMESFESRIMVPDEVLFEEGSRADAMFIVVMGSLEIRSKCPRTGVEISCGEINQGEVFGEMGILLRKNREAACVSLTYAELLVLTKEQVERIMTNFPSFFHVVTKHARKKFGSGWSRVRMALRLAKIATIFSYKETNVYNALGLEKPEQAHPHVTCSVPKTSVLDREKMFDSFNGGTPQVFNHYVFKAKREKEKEAFVNQLSLSSSSKRKETIRRRISKPKS